jgi:predicted HAD superfamily Cof-like phosphohydrolase
VSIFEDQFDFMEQADQAAIFLKDGVSAPQWAAQLHLYNNLIAEESEEFSDAFSEKFKLDAAGSPDIDGMSDDEFIAAIGDIQDIKEAVDVIVVAAGYLITRLGKDGAQKAWNLVHETNLAKVRGGAIKREDGKVLQTDEYKTELKAQLHVALRQLLLGL